MYLKIYSVSLIPKECIMTRQFSVQFSYINLTEIADTVLLTLGAGVAAK